MLVILLLCVLIIVFLLTRKLHAWRMKRAYLFVVEHLKQQEAFGPPSAVVLPYAKTSMFQFGTRDYRPKAIHYLIMGDILGVTQDGRYYLKDRETALKFSRSDPD